MISSVVMVQYFQYETKEIKYIVTKIIIWEYNNQNINNFYIQIK